MSVKTAPRIYNLFPRLVGKMSQWVEHFDRIKDLGFDWVYINPFHYAGFSGSLYAPKDYYDFNPLFVDSSSNVPPMKQLEQAIQAAHKLGLKMIMDFVINHTAKDHPFVKQRPEWYQRNDNGEVKSPGAWDNGHYIEWGDLAEIDNENSPDRVNLWNYWKDLALFYIDKGFDGFRADAAYSIPPDLWKMLIDAAKKKNPSVTFFAESLGCSPEQTLALAKSGFDYIFNSSKWWDFQGTWLLDQYNSTKDIAPSISFPESHDTPRLPHECHGNMAAIKQRTVFSAFFASGWMVPVGFEFGFMNKTDVVSTYPEQWEKVNYDFRDFLREINRIKSSYRIFNEDNKMEIVPNDNALNVLVLRKTSKDSSEKALIVINKDVYNYQRVFYGNFAETLGVKNGTKILDVSVEEQMDDVPETNFDYHLPAGAVKLFYAKTHS